MHHIMFLISALYPLVLESTICLVCQQAFISLVPSLQRSLKPRMFMSICDRAGAPLRSRCLQCIILARPLSNVYFFFFLCFISNRMLLLLVGATDKAGDYAKTTMKSLRQSKRPKKTKPDFLGSRKTYL